MKFNFVKWVNLVILLLLIVNVHAQTNTQVQIDSLYSQILNEQRSYTVYLPQGYNLPINKNIDYPLYYVLDGKDKGEITHSIYKYLTNNLKPMLLDIIIVAIHQKDRFYELTPSISSTTHNDRPISKTKKMGGASVFLKHIREELAIEINQNYRVNDYKGIIGHSLGGLFVLNAIIESPEYFHSAIVIDPSFWWNNGEILKRYKNEKPNSNLALFFAAAKSKNHHQNVLTQDFMQWLKNEKIFAAFEFLYLKNKNHHTVVIPALQEGLNFVIGDDSFLNIEGYTNIHKILEYYDSLSLKKYATIEVPSSRLLRYAYLLGKLGKAQECKAIEDYIKKR